MGKDKAATREHTMTIKNLDTRPRCLPEARASSLFVLVALVFCAWPLPARANDGAFGSAGGSLIPLKNKHVRMVSEEIVLEVEANTKKRSRDDERLEWHVTASYLFENTSGEEVTVKVGFPELACDGDSPCPEDHPYSFHDLQTTVRGKKIKHKVDFLARQSRKLASFYELDRVHLFDVTFAPGEVVSIQHTYRHTLSSSVEGYSAHYVTRTGSLWARPIEQATFIVRVPWVHYYTSFPEEFKLVKREEKLLEEPLDSHKSMWTYTFEMKRWTPKADLYILFGNEAERLPKQCPFISEVWRDHEEALEEVARDAGKEKKQARARADERVRREHFDALSLEDLKICRNWPYAVHGYSFKTKELAELFYRKPFSTHCPFCGPGAESEVLDEDHPERFTRFFHMPNMSYDPAMLDARELLYVRLAKEAEGLKKKDQKSN